MKKTSLLVALLVAGSWPLGAQETPPAEPRLFFHFKDASIESVLLYVSQVTGWIFVQEAPLQGTITAYSRSPIAVSGALDFLDLALRQHGLAVLNPVSPRLPGPGGTLLVVRRGALPASPPGVHVGLEPQSIPSTDEVRTQIIPLRSVSAAEAAKELADILRKAVGEGGQVAVSTYSNAIILTGRSEGIHRMAEILRVIDQTASARLKIAVFPLLHADATEAARTLNEVYRPEAPKGEGNGPASLRTLLGAVRAGTGGDRGPDSRSLAHEIVRFTPEPRTNAILVTATDENLERVERLIRDLDQPSAALNTYVVWLKYSDAVLIADLLNRSYGTPGRAATASASPRSAIPTSPTSGGSPAPGLPGPGPRGATPRR